jgi:asparagine synthase (glutamine-hydrolysing)
MLAAHRRFGDEAPSRLVGEFAFAIWDADKRTLLAVASAPLAPPLYFHDAGDRFAFAGRARALLALPGVARRVDEEHVASFLTHADTGADRTFFRGIRRLLPGQRLVARRGGVAVTPWWRPDLHDDLSLRDDAEYVAAFEELLEGVIDDHLPAGGRCGALLSGGLDSGAVATTAAPLLDRAGRRLAAYTHVPHAAFAGAVMDGRYADETPHVEALASMHPNVDLQLVPEEPRGLLEGAEHVFAATESPIRNASNRGWLEAIFARARADGVSVLLNGDQGNLTASWDGSGLLMELVRHGRLLDATREARALAHSGGASSAGHALVRLGIQPFLPQGVNVGISMLRGGPRVRGNDAYGTYSLIAPSLAAELDLASRDRNLRRRVHRLPVRGLRARRLRTLVATGVTGAPVLAGYRELFGIDIRTPLADRRLVEFCLRVPEAQFAREGTDRRLIRRAMAGRLPEPTLRGRQRGLQAPSWSDDIARERPQLLAAVGRFERDDLARRVLDLPRLRTLLEHWPRTPPTSSADVQIYRGAVPSALMTGAFLLWAQEAA